MQRTPTKLVTNIPPGVGADSSRPYPCITKYTYSHNRIRVFVPHFVGVSVYAGTINRPLQLLVVCHFVANGLLIMQRTPTKYVANTPSGVGGDSSRPYPCITKYTYPFHRIRVFVPPHTHFRPPFRGCIHICGHDKSVPYGCLWSAVMLLTDC